MKNKSARCSTGHGTGVIQERQLSWPPRRYRIHSTLSPREVHLANERMERRRRSGGQKAISLSLNPPKKDSKQNIVPNFVKTGMTKIMRFFTRRQS